MRPNKLWCGLRSGVFLLWMAVTVIPWATAVLLVSIFVRGDPVYWMCAGWLRVAIWGARTICGVRWRVQGMDNLPTAADRTASVILLSKHQSTWETFAYPALMPHPLAYVFKRELLYIPFFGWAMARLDMVHIDRSKRTEAWNRVAAQGAKVMARGHWVIMFPEGTRIARGKAATGFGSKHFKAGWRQWGQAMQNDLADGARWAIAQGIADPRRIAIAGASYGGYAAMMGLVNDPDLFRCAVNWVGVTDLMLMYTAYWSDIDDESKRYGLPRLLGDPKVEADKLRAHSPLHQAARIRQPVLMAYGGVDERVPIAHGERMRDALRAHNPAVEFIEYPSEGHGWARPETNIDFWGRVETFLGRHLAPR